VVNLTSTLSYTNENIFVDVKPAQFMLRRYFDLILNIYQKIE